MDNNDDSLVTNEDLLCAICGDKSLIQLDELMSYTKCGHTVCVPCGNQWNNMNSERLNLIKCPTCNEVDDYKTFKIDKRWKSVLREMSSDKKNFKNRMLEEIEKRLEEEKRFQRELEEKNRQNEQLKRENEELLEEKSRIIDMIRQKEMENQEICSEVEENKRELQREKEKRLEEKRLNKELTEEKKRLLEEIRKKEEENEQIKKEIQTNQENLQREKRKIEREKVNLEKDLQIIEEQKRQVEQLRLQSDQEKGELEEELRRIKRDKKNMEREKKELELENERIREEKEKMLQEKENLRQENETFRVEKENLETEKRKLERKFNNVQQEKITLEESHREKVDELQEKLNGLRREAEESERERLDLLEQLKNTKEKEEGQNLYKEKAQNLLQALKKVEIENQSKNTMIKEYEEQISLYNQNKVPTTPTQVSQAINLTSRYITTSMQYLPNMDFFYEGYKKLMGQKLSVGILKKDSSEFSFLEKRGSNLKSPVYKAKYQNELVAVKKISLKYSKEKEDDIFRESMLIYNLSEIDGVIELKGMFMKDNFLHLVFPFVEHDLEHLIFLNKRDHKLIDVNQKSNIALQLVETIYQIHKYGVVHRDLRPASILCKQEKDNWYPLVGSWNKACYERDARSFHSPSYFRYKPPESFYGKVTSWKAYDVWTLGCILGELFLGEPLFYIWSDKKRDALKSFFFWKECTPDNYRDFLPEHDPQQSKSLLFTLLENDVEEWLANLICSFLSFNTNREINFDQDNFNIKELNYSTKNLEDQFIEEWIKKHFEISNK